MTHPNRWLAVLVVCCTIMMVAFALDRLILGYIAALCALGTYGRILWEC